MYNHPCKFWQSQTGDNVNYHINIYYNLISMHNYVCTSYYLDLDVVVPWSIWPKIVFAFFFFSHLKGDLKMSLFCFLLVFLNVRQSKHYMIFSSLLKLCKSCISGSSSNKWDILNCEWWDSLTKKNTLMKIYFHFKKWIQHRGTFTPFSLDFTINNVSFKCGKTAYLHGALWAVCVSVGLRSLRANLQTQ